VDRKNLDQIITESLAIEAEDAKEAGKLGYMARALVQATMPHKATTEKQFIRRNGTFELSITALSRDGLPFGSIPRLLLSWMTTEAVYTRSPVLELGPTLSAFMAELGLGRRGGTRGDITRFRNQATRLFSSAIYCRYTEKDRDQGKGFNLVNNFNLWWTPKKPDQYPLWKSSVTLGTDFFNEIIERPVPVDMLALRALKRSPMALDIYFWLTYRMSYLSKDTVIPWPLLQMQFGADYGEGAEGLRNFRKKFLARLADVKIIYEKVKVFPVEKGLLLKPSPPHVAKRPVPMLPGSRKGVKGGGCEAAIAALLPSSDISLGLETFEKAKKVAPRLDVYALEGEWRMWIARTGKMPDNPDGAFIGFCRMKYKQGGGN